MALLKHSNIVMKNKIKIKTITKNKMSKIFSTGNKRLLELERTLIGTN